MTDDTGLDVARPHDIDAERAVLGLAMCDPRHLTAARSTLNGGCEFYRPAHEALWATLCRYQDAGEPTDVVAVQARVQADRALSRAFGGNAAPYLLELWQLGQSVTPRPDYFARTVHDLYRKRQHVEFGIRHAQIAAAPDTDPDQLDYEAADHLEQMVQSFEHRTTGGHLTSWSPLDMEAVMNGQDLDPPPDLGRREDGQALFYQNALHVIAAEPESGKTFLAVWLAVQTMKDGRRVTYVDFESHPAQILSRALQLGATPDMMRGDDPPFRYLRPHDAITADPSMLGEFDAACHGSDLVILDGMTEALSIHSLDQNSSNDIARFYDLLPRRARRASGAAVVMIDHVTKAKDTRDRWAIGSQHKLAGVDVMYLLAPVEPLAQGRHGYARLTISKDRGGHVRQHSLGGRVAGDFHLDATGTATRAWVEGVDGIPRAPDGSERPTIIMEKISRWLEDPANAGAYTRAIRSAKLGSNEHVNNALHRLRVENWVRVDTQGGAHRHYVEKPFRADDDPAQTTSEGW